MPRLESESTTAGRYVVKMRDGRRFDCVEVVPQGPWLQAVTIRYEHKIDHERNEGYRVPVGRRRHLIPAMSISDVFRDEPTEAA